MIKGKRHVLLDSSVYGAMIDDERHYPVDSKEHWDIVYSKAIMNLLGRLEFYGCRPIEEELKRASDIFSVKLLEKYSIARRLRETKLVSRLGEEYRLEGIYPPDAVILAYVSAHRIDMLVTINRRHLKAPETLRKLKGVNKRHRLRCPLILIPGELFELII